MSESYEINNIAENIFNEIKMSDSWRQYVDNTVYEIIDQEMADFDPFELERNPVEFRDQVKDNILDPTDDYSSYNIEAIDMATLITERPEFEEVVGSMTLDYLHAFFKTLNQNWNMEIYEKLQNIIFKKLMSWQFGIYY